MRSVEAQFRKFYSEFRSSLIVFNRAVKYKNFTRDSIARNFIVLVDKEDYCWSDKNTLIDYAHNLSNQSEEHKIDTKNPQIQTKI